MASNKTKARLSLTLACAAAISLLAAGNPAVGASNGLSPVLKWRTTISPDDVPEYDSERGVVCHSEKSPSKARRICLRVA